MRNSALIALGLTAALAACSGGGSFGTTPAAGVVPANTAPAVTTASTVRTASDHHESDSCDQGDGRHGDSAVRNGRDHGHEDGGGDDGHDNSSCCATGSSGVGTRDHGRDDGDGGDGDHHATPTPKPTPCASATPAPTATPSPTPTPTPSPAPRLVGSPAALTIDCSVSSTAAFSIAGNPAGGAASAATAGLVTVAGSTDRAGHPDFLVTGVGNGTTTINLTDAAGGTGTVSVTTVNCPAGTPVPSPTPSATPGR